MWGLALLGHGALVRGATVLPHGPLRHLLRRSCFTHWYTQLDYTAKVEKSPKCLVAALLLLTNLAGVYKNIHRTANIS